MSCRILPPVMFVGETVGSKQRENKQNERVRSYPGRGN